MVRTGGGRDHDKLTHIAGADAADILHGEGRSRGGWERLVEAIVELEGLEDGAEG